MATIDLASCSDASAADASPTRSSWLTFALVFALMMVDFIDRQVVVSMFGHLKAEFDLSDKQLGALVSVVSITVGFGALPVALWLDRWSRTRGIMVMGTLWSMATMACGMASSFSQLFVGRMLIGAGEAGYGPAGGALIATRFPLRMRGFILGAFQSAGGIGAIVGVILGGYLAERWGWRAAFGLVGAPGLVLALLFWFIPDYKTVTIRPAPSAKAESFGSLIAALYREIRSSRTALLTSLGAAMQFAVITTMTTWLPSFFGRVHAMPSDRAGATTALAILAFSVGAVLWGRFIDRISESKPTRRLHAMAVLCVTSTAIFMFSFGVLPVGRWQIVGVVLGCAVMSCTIGTVLSITVSVIHPAFRASAIAFVALVGNLGMGLGPLVVGTISDAYGLNTALTLVPLFGVLAAWLFSSAVRSYADDMARVARFEPNLSIAQPGAQAA